MRAYTASGTLMRRQSFRSRTRLSRASLHRRATRATSSAMVRMPFALGTNQVIFEASRMHTLLSQAAGLSGALSGLSYIYGSIDTRNPC